MVNEATQNWVQAPPDSTGKHLDTRYYSTLTQGTVVHREVMHLGGTTISAIATVTNSRLDINAMIPGIVRLPNSSSSFAASIPGYVRPLNTTTAASFLVKSFIRDTTGTAINPVLYKQLPDALGRLTRASSISVTLSTNTYAPLSDPASSTSTVVTLTSNNPVAVLNAAGVGLRNYISAITIANTSGSAVRIEFYDRNTTGPRKYQAQISTTNPGITSAFPTPIQCTSNSTTVARLVPTVTDIRATIIGYQGP